jgi:hypothetical protein
VNASIARFLSLALIAAVLHPDPAEAPPFGARPVPRPAEPPPRPIESIPRLQEPQTSSGFREPSSPVTPPSGFPTSDGTVPQHKTFGHDGVGEQRLPAERQLSRDRDIDAFARSVRLSPDRSQPSQYDALARAASEARLDILPWPENSGPDRYSSSTVTSAMRARVYELNNQSNKDLRTNVPPANAGISYLGYLKLGGSPLNAELLADVAQCSALFKERRFTEVAKFARNRLDARRSTMPTAESGTDKQVVSLRTTLRVYEL